MEVYLHCHIYLCGMHNNNFMFALGIRMCVFNVCYYYVIDSLFHLNFNINLYYLHGKNEAYTGIAQGTPVRILRRALVRWNSSRRHLYIVT
jgi:hypothetical protein